MTTKRPTVDCPNCGAEFRAGRLACPECGSDAETGWRSSEDIDYASVDLPESDSEHGPRSKRPSLVVFSFVVLLVLLLIGLVT